MIFEDATNDGLKLKYYYTLYTINIYFIFTFILKKTPTKLANLSNTNHKFIQIINSASCEN